LLLLLFIYFLFYLFIIFFSKTEQHKFRKTYLKQHRYVHVAYIRIIRTAEGTELLAFKIKSQVTQTVVFQTNFKSNVTTFRILHLTQVANELACRT